MTEGRIFSELNLSGWRQFKDVEIQFHDRLTILTGANGAGKSTILKILKSDFPEESNESFLATPIQEGKKMTFSLGKWFSSVFKSVEAEQRITVGSINYSDSSECTLYLPFAESMIYSLEKVNNSAVDGINIDSHRSLVKYEKILNIPMFGTSPAEALREYNAIQRSYFSQSFYRKDGNSKQLTPIYSLKEMLISFATFGKGNEFVSPMPELEGLYEKFQNILRVVLPAEIGFQELQVRVPEVVISSSSGVFPIDGASGGLMSIIQLSWQLFLKSESVTGRFVVLIDEPENHLHPSMQRTFLSNIVAAFPMAQFIVATHSPFVISSVKDSSVYALRHHTSNGGSFRAVEPRSVNSEKLDHVTKAGPANEILREVLGVPVTIPDWSALELHDIAAQFADQELTAETLKELRQRLDAAGLSEFYPDAVARILS